LGIKEMPMYNGFRGSRGESIGTQRTFRCLPTGANYTTKAATSKTPDTPYSQSFLDRWTQRLGSSESSS
jgi:hypothetical protein